MNDQLTIKYIPLEKAVFFDRNSKKHDIGLIASLISKYGFKDPPKWEPELNNGEGGIVEGNGRIEALARLKEQGEEPPRGIAIAGDDWAVPVLFGVDCDSEQLARAYALDHNISTMAGGEYTALDISRMFDTEKYLAELEDLCGSGAMPVSIDGDDLDLLLEQLTNLTEESEENQQLNTEGIDDVPDVNEVESRVKLGDIWQLGRHKIACGDSTIEKNVRRLLGDRFDDVGMVWSDPPYGFGLMKEGSAGKIGNSRVYAAIANDQDTKCAVRAVKLCKIFNVTQIWWGANYFADVLPPSKCWIIWDKDHHGMTFADAELAWVSVDKPVRCFRHAWSGGHRDSEKGEQRVHVNQKPVALCEWFFEKYGQPDDLIFDPFLGSAPSIIAAQKMGGNRTVYGFELSEHYCEVIIQRWGKLTGKVAQKISEL